MIDPYPQDLDEIDAPINVNQEAVLNRAITAMNRLAQAIEQNTLAILDRPQSDPTPAYNPPPALAALPPVQTVANTPACPYHGTAKVRPSTNGKGGFYCASTASPGQPANPKGYCTWHT